MSRDLLIALDPYAASLGRIRAIVCEMGSGCWRALLCLHYDEHKVNERNPEICSEVIGLRARG